MGKNDFDIDFDFDEEYIFNIKGMYFVNVDGNMKLSLSQVELINESVNKEYENGKIGKITLEVPEDIEN